MRSVASFRWIVAVVVLVGVAVAAALFVAGGGGAPTDAVSVAEAVARSRAAGSARFSAQLTAQHPKSAPAVHVEGVTSLVGPEASVVARTEGRSEEAAVRVNAAGAWLRAPGADWVAVDPSAVDVAAGARGWSDLLAGLRASGSSPETAGNSLRASHNGDPAKVWLDRRGRIQRFVVTRDAATLDLRFTDYGVVLDVEAPPLTP